MILCFNYCFLFFFFWWYKSVGSISLSTHQLPSRDVKVGAASEGEVNEDISHESPTGGPIMKVAVDSKEVGVDVLKKASPLIKWVTT